MRILLVVNHNSDPLVVSAYVADCFSHSDLEVDVLNVLPSAEGNVAGVVQGQGGNVVYYFRLTHPSRHNHQNSSYDTVAVWC